MGIGQFIDVGPGELVRLRSVTILRIDPRDPGRLQRFLLLNSTIKDDDRVRFDVARSQRFERTWDVTQRPLGSGARVSDHRRRRPDSFTVTGTLTDTPLGLGLLDLSNVIRSRALELYQQLEALAEQEDPLLVATSSRYLEHMVITKLADPRDSKTGRAIVVEMRLQEVRVVSPLSVGEVVDIDSTVYGADKILNGGAQSPAPFTGNADLAAGGVGIP